MGFSFQKKFAFIVSRGVGWTAAFKSYIYVKAVQKHEKLNRDSRYPGKQEQETLQIPYLNLTIWRCFCNIYQNYSIIASVLHVDLLHMCSENLYFFSPSQNFLNLPSVFVQQFFTIYFHIHLIKAELNSCDIQANKVLNFCKCFLSEKRWKKRQSSNILKQNSTTHRWHVESFGGTDYPLSTAVSTRV